MVDLRDVVGSVLLKTYFLVDNIRLFSIFLSSFFFGEWLLLPPLPQAKPEEMWLRKESDQRSGPLTVLMKQSVHACRALTEVVVYSQCDAKYNEQDVVRLLMTRRKSCAVCKKMKMSRGY